MTLSTEESLAIFDALMADWSATNVAGDSEAMGAFYAQDSFFLGSTPQLYRGPAGVVSYFRLHPPGTLTKVEYWDTHVIQLAEDVIAFAFLIDFHSVSDGKPFVYEWRATFTLKREPDGVWRIAVHHAAPRPK